MLNTKNSHYLRYALAALLLIFRAALCCFEGSPSKEDIVPLNHIEELSINGQLLEAKILADSLLKEKKDLPQEIRVYLFHKTLWLQFELKDYEGVIESAKMASQEDAFASLMHAAALKNLNLLTEAEKVLEGNNEPLGLMESGTIRFLKGDTESARDRYLSAAANAKENPQKESALLNLSFMALAEKNAELIDNTLSVSSPNALREAALSYLQAKKEYLMGNKVDALNSLSLLLENNLPETLKNSLFFEFGSLSVSCIADPHIPKEEQIVHFKRGCEAFRQMIERGHMEEGWTLLGKSHLMLLLYPRPLEIVNLERVKTPGIDDCKRPSINPIQGRFQSIDPRRFHAAPNSQFQTDGGITSNEASAFEIQSIITALNEIRTPMALQLAFILTAEMEPDLQKKEALYGSLPQGPFMEEAWMLRIRNLKKWGIFLTHKGFREEGMKPLKKARELLLNTITALSPFFKKESVLLLAELTLVTGSDEKEVLPLLVEDKVHRVYRALFEFNAAVNKDVAADKLLAQVVSDDISKEAKLLIAEALFDQKYYDLAKRVLTRLDMAEAYFLSALIAEKQQQYAEKRDLFKTLIDRYPDHPLSEEAEFNFYTIGEYLSGGSPEIKHLEQSTQKHKESYYLPIAYYVIGLDFKKDRKSKDGKWIRKKSLSSAIDAFSLSFSTFEYLKERNLIPKDRLDSYCQLGASARLEQGSCNFEIAKESKGAKRQLFLEYSKEILGSINGPVAKLLLAEALIELNEIDPARLKLQEIICSEAPHEFHYAKAHSLLSETFIKEKNYKEALRSLEYADSCQGFSSEEMLSIAMQKGFCLKSLGLLDEAMAIFSSVVNASVVSSLRIEGMFERAYIYKDQNRIDLYRKQLEAILKIGGNWKDKARKLLDETYGQ